MNVVYLTNRQFDKLYSGGELEDVADLDCGSRRTKVMLQIDKDLTLVFSTSEWAQVYKVKTGVEKIA